MHPTCLHQLTHAGIDDRIARLAATPCGKSFFSNRALIVHKTIQFAIEILPTRIGETEHDVSVEIAPS